VLRTLKVAGELVLIVEDNERNRKLLRKVLEKKGFRTIEVENGEAAVDAARNDSPDLVLMDYQLPGIDGIEAFRRIRAEPSIRRMPIVAVTASAMPEDMARMREAGFDGFETKPIDVKQLLATIARLLSVK
jgi:two-component system cell cycle response regulator DivK